NTDEPARGKQLHRDNRASSGNEDRVSRGNCAADGIHRRPETDGVNRPIAQRRISRVFGTRGGRRIGGSSSPLLAVKWRRKTAAHIFFGIARGAANALAKAWGVDRDWSVRRAMLK